MGVGSPCNVHPVPVPAACQEVSPWATAGAPISRVNAEGAELGQRGRCEGGKREGRWRQGWGRVETASWWRLPASLLRSRGAPQLSPMCVSRQMPAPRAEAKPQHQASEDSHSGGPRLSSTSTPAPCRQQVSPATGSSVRAVSLTLQPCGTGAQELG